MIYSGVPQEGRIPAGVEILISKKQRSNLTNYVFTNERLESALFKVERRQLKFFSVYVPEEDTVEATRQFHEDLHHEINKVMQTDHIVICAYFNALIDYTPIQVVVGTL